MTAGEGGRDAASGDTGPQGVAPEAPSKSARKRAHKALQVLGDTLMALSPAELERVCADPELRAVAAAGRNLRKGARARHVRHLGNLLARVDVSPLEEALAELRGESATATARLHRAERWRERLLGESGDAAMTELLEAYPGADRQHLRTLVRLARVESARGASPRRFRELLRVLRGLDEGGA
jgi:ribosome-associated protein